MTTQATIKKLADQLVQKFHPEKIILFGSHAYGSPREGSDVDLFIIMNHDGSSVKKASEIRLSLPSDISVDVVVRTPEKVEKRIERNDYFIREVISKGTVLYAAGN